MKRKRAKPVYKEYTMGQMVLLPTNLEELIPENHLVRVVNEFIERMDSGPLEARYKGGGTSSYHPKMMLKVYVYAYTQRIYSGRRIAKALRESIPFMWLSGNNHPDFRTINHFRGHILKGIIQEVFCGVLWLLIEGGYIRLEDYFVDGTKMEANANRYTYVWAKSTERYQKQLSEKVAALFEEIETINAEEDARYGGKDLEEVGEVNEIRAEKLAQQVDELNKSLKSNAVKTEGDPDEEPATDGPIQSGGGESLLSKAIETKLQEMKQTCAERPENKRLAKAANRLENEYLSRAKKYEQQQRTLAGRNSYSKTDPQATFMRMKDDRQGTGPLKPAYNIQLGTEHQFVVGFSVHQEAGDSNCFVAHLDQLKSQLHRLPQKVNGDAAYGSEENYAYLEQAKVDNYLKYSSFDREQKKHYKPNPFKVENLPYDAEKDVFTCPNGQPLTYLSTVPIKTRNGFSTERRRYACADCSGCPLKDQCTKAAGNRLITVGFQLQEYRRQARENLLSTEGQRLRSQRGVDVETVFGRIKDGWGFRRFLLRGLQKVGVEWGLLCLAHNLAKVWSSEDEKRLAAV